MTTKFNTFLAKQTGAIATITFNYPPVNIQGWPMIEDLNKLADELEIDKSVKVVIFESSNPDFFVAHADVDMLKDMPQKAVERNKVEVNDLAKVLERISKLPQATIAKIEGYARGGGHEMALACDMRFAARGKAIFMQMEVGMGILPCGGGASRMARQVGLGKALEIILSAKDFNADEAYAMGTINKALDPDKIGIYVYELANRIAQFPSESITACKRAVYASIDLPIEEALKEESYQLYQATSQTPAIKRFTTASDTNFQNSLENQKNFQTLLMSLQEIK
ncbi:enoyl-CoA hydratase [Candidatus Epulonipiscioides gigas]|nr:enoyl-CoA hydratase [Epulopiscium sp. SCG-C07WGA-EpuloA2]